jgi:hypothetical protein
MGAAGTKINAEGSHDEVLSGCKCYHHGVGTVFRISKESSGDRRTIRREVFGSKYPLFADNPMKTIPRGTSILTGIAVNSQLYNMLCVM